MIGDVFDRPDKFVVAVIFGAALIGVIRLILGLVKAAKTPPPPPIKSNLETDHWSEGTYEGTIDGDVWHNNWEWHDSGSHSTIDYNPGDGGGVCDASGFDGGGGHCN